MLSRRNLIVAAATAPLPLLSRAQTLDSARILTGFPPGGTVDVVARRVADKLRGAYARVMLVENKPGAGGRIAVEELKRSANDGSTLLITPAAMITLYPHLYPKLATASATSRRCAAPPAWCSASPSARQCPSR